MEILSYSFLKSALAGALLSAFSTSLLSVFISLKKISFMSNTLAHMAFAGIALGLLLNVSVTGAALVFVLFVTLIIGFMEKRYRLNESDTTTIFLSVSMALALVLIRLKKGYTQDFTNYLFGNILLISPTDIKILIFLGLLNLLFLLLFFKEIFYMTYNRDMAFIYKIPVTPISYLFLVFLALNIVLSVKITGIILVTAQFILPGATALNLTRNLKKAVPLSTLLALFSGLTGFFLSYYLNMPSGATIVLTMFFVFLLSLLSKRFRSS